MPYFEALGQFGFKGGIIKYISWLQKHFCYSLKKKKKTKANKFYG